MKWKVKVNLTPGIRTFVFPWEVEATEIREVIDGLSHDWSNHVSGMVEPYIESVTISKISD